MPNMGAFRAPTRSAPAPSTGMGSFSRSGAPAMGAHSGGFSRGGGGGSMNFGRSGGGFGGAKMGR